ncbi:SDR family NAD(P)-dependent oxidoreductase [Pseudomonas japonica]|uniref:NAD(P)-dependent dehydrogenase, short-chain alcohol dehydrogenase family n=1 Tax=Pseudomonas japonica TaxID=256466 RepID=A0A239KGY7_9PSED|nr:SDR family oxidoreductase [Pseudomonas japonica]SNT16893.1 NAD(P)-dependent dehydrogenase, short-chain alcohol dehydrogenase family [Pseudomonas japonica]
MKRTVLITGAGSGIGAACVQRLAALGDNLVLVGRRRAALQQVAAGSDALVLAGDAADSATWAGFVEQIRARFGGLDALICCAGGHGLGSAVDTSDEAWEAALRGNLHSAFHSARACLPLLVERRGSIVLLGSIASLAAGPEVCGYTTAKHALVGLNRSLARDFGPQGVRVNCVCPGWVRTPMADEEMQPLMHHYGEDLDAAYRRVTADVPLRRPATADEIAALCQFLIGPEASIVTGAVIAADGGSTIVDVPTLAYTHLETPA